MMKPTLTIFSFLLLTINFARAASDFNLCRMILNTDLSVSEWAAAEVQKINDSLKLNPETKTIETEYELWSQIAQELKSENPKAEAEMEEKIDALYTVERVTARRSALRTFNTLFKGHPNAPDAFKTSVIDRVRNMTVQVDEMLSRRDHLKTSSLDKLIQETSEIKKKRAELKTETKEKTGRDSTSEVRNLVRDLDCSTQVCMARAQKLNESFKEQAKEVSTLFAEASSLEMSMSDLVIMMRTFEVGEHKVLATAYAMDLEIALGRLHSKVIQLTNLSVKYQKFSVVFDQIEKSRREVSQIKTDLDPESRDENHFLQRAYVYLKVRLAGI